MMEVRRVGEGLEISVPAQPASLGQVRRVLRAFLAEHGVEQDRRDSVVLVAHELVLNAIVHGSTAADDVVEMTVTPELGSLVVRVLNPGRSEASPGLLEASAGRESGRGLVIVDRLASWGQARHDGRWEVTAKVPLGPPGLRISAASP